MFIFEPIYYLKVGLLPRNALLLDLKPTLFLFWDVVVHSHISRRILLYLNDDASPSIISLHLPHVLQLFVSILDHVEIIPSNLPDRVTGERKYEPGEEVKREGM